jgi:type IV pilus assembly protein PilA
MKLNKNKNEKGFSLVELLVVVIIIAIVAAIAIPNLLASRRAANEASAISTLRTIHSAESTYQATTGNSTDYATGADLDGLVDIVLAQDAFSKSGYDFTVATGTTATTYCGEAHPTTPTGAAATGTRSFAIGVDGVIYVDAADAAACTDGVATGSDGPLGGGAPAP